MVQFITQNIFNLISSIDPYDNIETGHIETAKNWVKSGVPIFRISKPDNPPMHLVSYFIPFDSLTNKILAVDHISAGLWLPPGGHVEIDEDPKKTVIREAAEELGLRAKFTVFGDRPFFITITQTVGIPPYHQDVSLWYIIIGDSSKQLAFDKREFNSYRWFDPKELLNMPIKTLDPHMHRFVKKLCRYLEFNISS